MKLMVLLALSVCLAPQQNESGKSVAGSPATLLTSNRIEGLSEEARIVLATNYILNLEPGVSARKADDSVLLSTYDGAKIRVTAGNERIKVASPTVARLTPTGWDLGMSRTFAASEIRISRDEQDDTDNNLKSMQESAKKLKSKTDKPQDKEIHKKLRWRSLYGENPMPTAELFNTEAIQQLTHLSNIGF